MVGAPISPSSHRRRFWAGPTGVVFALVTVVAVALSVAATAAAVPRSRPAAASPAQAYGWGANNYGQLGDGTTLVRHLPVAVHLPLGTTIRALAAGSDFSLALTSSGTGLAWGGNEYGQLGDGTTLVRNSPVPVQLPVGVTIKAIAAGEGGTVPGFISGAFSLAVTSSGTVLAWGLNNYGQLVVLC